MGLTCDKIQEIIPQNRLRRHKLIDLSIILNWHTEDIHELAILFETLYTMLFHCKKETNERWHTFYHTVAYKDIPVSTRRCFDVVTTLYGRQIDIFVLTGMLSFSRTCLKCLLGNTKLWNVYYYIVIDISLFRNEHVKGDSVIEFWDIEIFLRYGWNLVYSFIHLLIAM